MLGCGVSAETWTHLHLNPAIWKAIAGTGLRFRSVADVFPVLVVEAD
jgi:hypothetical protein